MTSDNPFKVLSSKTVYKNPWINVREDIIVRPDGSDGLYGVIETNNCAMAVALNDQGEVFMIKGFSYPVSTWNWQFPGGGCDGDDPAVTARRELAEETGITANNWQFVGKMRVCNGLMTEEMSVYLAQDLSLGDKVEADDKDLIREGKFVSFDEIDQMIGHGDIDDGQTITGLYLVERWLKKNIVA